MSCDCEAPSAFFEKTRIARKAHRCCECKRTIAKGEPYEYASGIWEDGALSFKTCAQCAAMRKDFEHYDECGICFGDLGEAAHNAGIDFIYGDVR